MSSVTDRESYTGGFSPGQRTKGLTNEQAERARELHGSNRLSEQKQHSFISQLMENFSDPIIKILLIALGINLLLLLRGGSWYEPVGIGATILLATLVSTITERGSEAAFRRLQEEASRLKCRVWRGGQLHELPVDELVVGDTVALQAGERVPADGVLFFGELETDQSALNGEAKPARKRAMPPEGDERDLMNPSMLFRSTIIVSGDGEMRVTHVGDDTFYGSLAREISDMSPDSPLKHRLGELAGRISKMGYIGAALVAAAYLINTLLLSGGSWAGILALLNSPVELFAEVMHALTLAVVVIVVAVPEGLPMMITVALSSNMKRMLKDNVLVRKLVGIETSGSLNILFTDKTGTLTTGQMSVSGFWDGTGIEYPSATALAEHEGLWELTHAALLGVNASYMADGAENPFAIGGNATDRALLTFAHSHAALRLRVGVSDRIPFTSGSKFTAARLSGELNLTVIAGAADRILPYCSSYYDTDGQSCAWTRRGELSERIKELSARAFRLVALAASTTRVTEQGSFMNLRLIGVIALRDELRPEAARSIKQIREADIQVVMITGDSAETAGAIARDSGLAGGEGELIITSRELANMDDDEVKRILPDLRVVARALPSDKSRLIRLAQESGLVAGMTGDGINDAPALKRADVGFAMGSGTEVAKEAGDIVILDDNILSITKAIRYGRTIFKSIRKFIIFQLTMNLCAVGLSVIGPFIGVETPVTMLQMLWVNMVMDTLAGLAFGGEPPLEEVMREKPKRRDEPIINLYMMGQILWTGIYTTMLCILFLKTTFVSGMVPQDTSVVFMTAFFTLFMFTGILNSFSARTHRLNLLAHIKLNPTFWIVMCAISVIQIAMVYVGGPVLRTAPLPPAALVRSIALAATVLPIDLLRKYLLRKRGRFDGC